MKIVILDGYAENPGDLSWDSIGQFGELTVYDRTPEAEILNRIGNAEVIFTNKTPLTRDVFEACPSIKYVGVLATGYNIVDVAAAKEFGVIVTSIPTYGTAAVAQYVFALLLELCHHVGHHSSTVKEGRWSSSADWCYWDYPLIELARKTMGIIGFGRIGKATANIAVAMGLRVLVYDTKRDPAVETAHIQYAGLDVLLRESDVISLHCPLFESTREIIRSETIAKMKDNVLLINTARGPLIRDADLAAALKSGKVAGAAVDVLDEEPPKNGSPLIGARNCIVTPHIAWAPRESRARLMDIAAENLKAFLAGNPVNTVS